MWTHKNKEIYILEVDTDKCDKKKFDIIYVISVCQLNPYYLYFFFITFLFFVPLFFFFKQKFDQILKNAFDKSVLFLFILNQIFKNRLNKKNIVNKNFWCVGAPN